MKKVLERVHKNKPRVQKAPKQPKPSASIFTGGRRKRDRDELASSASWKDKMPKQIQQLFGPKKSDKHSGAVGVIVNHDTREPLLVKSY